MSQPADREGDDLSCSPAWAGRLVLVVALASALTWVICRSFGLGGASAYGVVISALIVRPRFDRWPPAVFVLLPVVVTLGLALGTVLKPLLEGPPVWQFAVVTVCAQILGQALGGKTFKLKFGHRGGNQPVKDLETGRVEITSQNHGFAVDPASLPADVAVNRINLNDQTVEGLRHKTKPVFCVQYHPEAAPGPHDSSVLFDEFRALVAKRG